MHVWSHLSAWPAPAPLQRPDLHLSTSAGVCALNPFRFLFLQQAALQAAQAAQLAARNPAFAQPAMASLGPQPGGQLPQRQQVPGWPQGGRPVGNGSFEGAGAATAGGSGPVSQQAHSSLAQHAALGAASAAAGKPDTPWQSAAQQTFPGIMFAASGDQAPQSSAQAPLAPSEHWQHRGW